MRRVLPMLLALALPALADMPRVGILATSSCDRDQGFYRAMRDLGYVEGRTIAYDCVIIGDRIGELPKIVNEMVARKPTLITASASPAIRAAQEATRAVPIVMGMSADAVREGFVRSLSHPEANTTGLTGMSMDLLAKRLEAARELLPQASRLAVLTRRAGLREAFMAAFTADMAIVAPRMGFVVKYYGVDDATEARAASADRSGRRFAVPDGEPDLPGPREGDG